MSKFPLWFLALTRPNMVIEVMFIIVVVSPWCRLCRAQRSNSFMFPKTKARYQLRMQDRKAPWNEIYWAWSWNLCPMWTDAEGWEKFNIEIINSARLLSLFFLLMDKTSDGDKQVRDSDEKITKLNQHHRKKNCVTNWMLMENDNMSNWIILERMFSSRPAQRNFFLLLQFDFVIPTRVVVERIQ